MRKDFRILAELTGQDCDIRGLMHVFFVCLTYFFALVAPKIWHNQLKNNRKDVIQQTLHTNRLQDCLPDLLPDHASRLQTKIYVLSAVYHRHQKQNILLFEVRLSNTSLPHKLLYPHISCTIGQFYKVHTRGEGRYIYRVQIRIGW